MMKSGVAKSGSPAPRSMTSRPCAASAFASCDTAIVADGLSWATLSDGRYAGGAAGGATWVVMAVRRFGVGAARARRAAAPGAQSEGDIPTRRAEDTNRRAAIVVSADKRDRRPAR
jgi:hypothetical protein